MDKLIVMAILTKTLTLLSPAFSPNGAIPSKYTCDGKNVSPPIQLEHIPEEAKSLALVVTDPDAHDFVHWLVWNLPVKEQIEEGTTAGIEGTNDFKKQAYGGPCPPSGVHHYVFKVYALDTELRLSLGAHLEDLENAMAGHVVATGELIGLYNRAR